MLLLTLHRYSNIPSAIHLRSRIRMFFRLILLMVFLFPFIIVVFTCVAVFPQGTDSASPILVKRSFPDPEPCYGNCSWVHDPSIYVQDGEYYRFSTSGNIAVATAKSLYGPWKYQGALLENGTNIVVEEERQDVWVCGYLHLPLRLPI